MLASVAKYCYDMYYCVLYNVPAIVLPQATRLYILQGSAVASLEAMTTKTDGQHGQPAACTLRLEQTST